MYIFAPVVLAPKLVTWVSDAALASDTRLTRPGPSAENLIIFAVPGFVKGKERRLSHDKSQVFISRDPARPLYACSDSTGRRM